MRRTVSTPVLCASVCVVLVSVALLHATPVSSSCLFSRFPSRAVVESRVQSCLPGAGREVSRLLDSGVPASAPLRRLQPRDARLSRPFLTLPSSSSSSLLSSSLSPRVSSSRKRLLPAAWLSVLRGCMRAVSRTRTSEGQPLLLPLPFSTFLRLHFLTTLLSFTALGFNAFLSSRRLVLLPSLPRACLQLLNGNNQLHVFLRGVCTPDLPALQATVSGPFFEELQFRFLLQNCLLSPLLAAVGSSWLSVAAGPGCRRLSPVKLEDGEATVRRDGQGASSPSDATASSKENAESTHPEARKRRLGSVEGSSLREKLARVLRCARLLETRERFFRDVSGANSSEKDLRAGCQQQLLQERREGSSPRCRVEQTLRIAITSILFALAHYVPPSVASPVRRQFRRAVAKQRTRLGFPLEPSGAKRFSIGSVSSFSSPSVKQWSPRSAAQSAAPDAASFSSSTAFTSVPLAEEELFSVDSSQRRVEDCVAANRILTAAVQGCVWSYAAEKGGFASALLLHILHNLQQFLLVAAFRTFVRRRQERLSDGRLKESRVRERISSRP
ncbi:CAAX protease self-immunity protein [Toxoplasma gondii GAB2-2007-GAL-DOM2]|uniref:CAAX protease self-immunity protein n=4 Tax=Toxoplasma gondii TaxID=5811 RepID=V4ZDN6_TOXGV|nr:CAAX protease self-immunity protein [Toxoplasma gondii VEG]KFG28500.1 CAAX protease self-immunity protein [Toxoplasma gondii p89]KFG32370.1 CAAX protease self-immunity protein [Toxoplasma gondii GAB2-2007-GAL-DOM2]PUA84116.1 CAAX protease self-immunity protein [Toxoplasma gondii TgCATBr9]CEL73537.1 TPA: hypothetical protein BN1205_080100 [Toxoplasma gondii VEG]